MAGFNEANTVQAPVLDLLVKAGWKHVPGNQLARATEDVLLTGELTAALARLNPVIAEKPARGQEIIDDLQRVILNVHEDGLVPTSQALLPWLQGRKTHQFLGTEDFRTITLMDFKNPDRNSFIVSDEVTFGAPGDTSRFDLVLWINGIPVVVIETKTRFNHKVTWVNAARDIHDIYETKRPGFFVPNAFSVATDGRELRYGSIRQPIDSWNMWGSTTDDPLMSGWERVARSVELLLNPAMVLSIIRDFTIYEVHRVSGRPPVLVKIVPRYPQVEAVNAILDRALHGTKRQGLIHHTQGSGKTLAMLFAAMRLTQEPALRNPTILAIADRVQLITQMANQFTRAGLKSTVSPEDSDSLRRLLAADRRGVIFSTVHKFNQAGLLSERENIIVLVDEAHRTQEGQLGKHLRAALPNARFFGFTGTPIADEDRNTFELFGDPDDPGHALNTYDSDRSIADGTTVPIHVAPRLVDFHVRKEELDQAFDDLADDEGLTEEQKNTLAAQATRTRTFFANPERVRKVVADMVEHFYSTVDPLGMKAQVVVYDRGLCVDYHEELTRQLKERAGEGEPDEAGVVMSVNSKDDPRMHPYRLAESEEEQLLDRFRAHGDRLKFLIVTSKLGTGFDAPIEGVMYLDKPMKLHTLFQTITRTNRTWRHPVTKQEKLNGLIVDYVGLGEGFARAMHPANPQAARKQIDAESLVDLFEAELKVTLVRFVGIDRTDFSFDTLTEVSRRLPDADQENDFKLQFEMLQGLWESAWPNLRLEQHKADYRWLARVYEYLTPADTGTPLLWEQLGAKTMQLVHGAISDVSVKKYGADLVIADHVTIRLLVETGAIKEPTPGEPVTVSAEEVLDTIASRLKKRLQGANGSHPAYQSIAERLDRLREQQVTKAKEGIDLLKAVLEIATDLTAAEKAEDAAGRPGLDLLPDPNIGALTQIFREYKPEGTPVVLDKVVVDIDQVVKEASRDWENWARTRNGDRQVRGAIRKVLKHYSLPIQGDLFDKAYKYVSENY
ncbi:HsdR family type I site-specific deoxyribonuclease [Glutamicibacter sp. V16R2B1]|uniref:type I restriction endonuclease subunit R n=1 Tax=unclassified Glutamicibacter TaxID=2627139 RepID=UPI0010FE0394|nr:HsdR family type I site-specific deoxyribonuclease [Glutamicibacter sp. V16R2B1]TLK54344.1 HsdR family type I site-specific deoxyribonuclease [Glutamicibacter sp. V16R2B1]